MTKQTAATAYNDRNMLAEVLLSLAWSESRRTERQGPVDGKFLRGEASLAKCADLREKCQADVFACIPDLDTVADMRLRLTWWSEGQIRSALRRLQDDGKITSRWGRHKCRVYGLPDHMRVIAPLPPVKEHLRKPRVFVIKAREAQV